MPTLNPDRTALVLIDLQNGIVDMDLAPRTGPQVVETARNLAARFREARAPVFLVHVAWAPDGADMPSEQVDKPLGARMGAMPSAWSELVPGLREAGDVVIHKRHWGAFTGTDLDLQLRRRGIDTIVLAGIATNFGVESTARAHGNCRTTSSWSRTQPPRARPSCTTSRSATSSRRFRVWWATRTLRWSGVSLFVSTGTPVSADLRTFF